MKKLVMSFCLILGVAFAASAADNSVFGTSFGVESANGVATLAITPLGNDKIQNDIPQLDAITCTVTMYSSITYHGVSYPVSETATASDCQTAGSAAGAAIDNLQKQYPQQ